MPTEGTYYLLFENQTNFEINEPITFDINNYTVTVNWKSNNNFGNCYYHEENLYGNEAIRQHTIKLVKNLEEIYQCKIKYILSKKVVLERTDPDAMGYIY